MTPIQRTVVLHKRSDQQFFGLHFGDDIPSGIYIITIEPNSPAAEANIQPGDRVLAVNGQLVSQISRNPRETVLKIARHVQTLTLTIQPSNILEFIDESSTNNFYNSYYRYSSNQNQDIDRNLESYITRLVYNDNLKIIPVSSWNNNKYMLMPDQYSVRSHHRHQKRKHYKTKQTQTFTDDQLKENISSSSPRRVVPSMGTSPVILRNSQVSTKNDETQENKSLSNIQRKINHQQFSKNEIVNDHHDSIDEKQQTILELNKTSQSINNEGLRVVHLYRSPNFQGFGFHVKFNKGYYLAHHIESHSPAQYSDLHENDVIRKINNQAIETISQSTFLQIMKENNQVTLVVQNFNDYKRTNPDVLRHETIKSTSNVINNNNKIDRGEQRSVLSNLFTKLKRR
ncbi:unnamed protein product [Rotaria sp. Silwood2]|nr:unnamed protein product [Rotaria sp. Silwood2]